eukprot:CAMPEP_0182889264 /NCGR_PEP_ID=MMETSP0034_2-20130328/21937_1 /TAXON_ID=156128 /ORGANISM="Nephroselmis pyriformis, Strain CCMP717" /LENGTH=155 /DNA_ID=CAMNT_0025022751 /DNA_START=122 /DNA_END=585 /DNA_ORIENTATION=-
MSGGTGKVAKAGLHGHLPSGGGRTHGASAAEQQERGNTGMKPRRHSEVLQLRVTSCPNLQELKGQGGGSPRSPGRMGSFSAKAFPTGVDQELQLQLLAANEKNKTLQEERELMRARVRDHVRMEDHLRGQIAALERNQSRSEDLGIRIKELERQL